MIFLMTIDEMIKFLQQQEGKNILLILQGIIITEIQVQQMKIKRQKNQLFFISKDNNKIGINLSQLMKITRKNENECFLEFDPLQNILIIPVNKS